MHCIIKVNTEDSEVELEIDSDVNATWNTSVLKESVTTIGNHSRKHQHIDIKTAQQMCNYAYEAGANKAARQLNKIKQILKE
jgi:hypothetical protein